MTTVSLFPGAPALAEQSESSDLSVPVLSPVLSTPGSDLLALGDKLERAGKIDEASEVYQKAVRSDEPAVRMQALERLDSLLEKERERSAEAGRMHNVVIAKVLESGGKALDLAIPMLLLILSAVILAWLLRVVPRMFIKRNDVRIVGFAKDPHNPLFQDLVYRMRDLMTYHFSKQRGITSLSQAGAPPSFHISVRSEQLTAYMGEMLLHLSDQAGPLVNMWLEYLDRSEYLLEGSLETASGQRHAVLRLKRHGALVELWERSFPVDATTDGFKDLAYLALIHLQQEMRTKHARDHPHS